MNPEAIIVFVVLIAINAFFSKNKAQKQQQRRNQQRQNQQRPAQHSADQQRSRQQRSTKDSEESGGYGLNQRRMEPSSEAKETVRPQRQRPRSLLEEVLQQYNITEDKDSSEKEIKSTEEIPMKAKETADSEDHYTDYSKRDQPKKSRKKKELKGYSKPRKKSGKSGEAIGDVIGAGSVEKEEIGTESFDKLLKFDQRSLVQGIVMAEILDKPKATRKKRAI